MSATGFEAVDGQIYLGPASLPPSFPDFYDGQDFVLADGSYQPMHDSTIRRFGHETTLESADFGETTTPNFPISDPQAIQSSAQERQDQSDELAMLPNGFSNENLLDWPINWQDNPQSLSYNAQGNMPTSIASGALHDGTHNNGAPLELNSSRSIATISNHRANSFGNSDCNSLCQLRHQKNQEVKKAHTKPRRRMRTILPSSVSSSNTTLAMNSGTPERQNPDGVTSAVCLLWLSKNQSKMPSEHTMSCLSDLFGDSVEKIRHWFSQNVPTSQRAEDTGYQTMTTSELDVASKYRRNRRECNRKAGNIGIGDTRLIEFERNNERPYACTSRCGSNFRQKAAWKRHEEINRPPEFWLCHLQACHRQPEKRPVFFRKDHFRNHLSKDHTNTSVKEADIAACRMPIKSNFSKYCIFRRCNKKFKTWKERIDHIADHLKGPWKMSQWRDPESDVEPPKDTAVEASDSDSESDTTAHEDDSDGSNGSDHDGTAPSAPRNSPRAEPQYSRFGPSGLGEGGGLNRRHYDGPPTNFSGHGVPAVHRSYLGVFQREVFWSSNSSHVDDQSRSLQEAGARRRSNKGTLSKSVKVWPLRTKSMGILASGPRVVVDEVSLNGHDCTMARKRTRHNSSKKKYDFHREAQIMKRLKHPHVARIIGSFVQVKSSTILMQPVADCTLLNYINAHLEGEPVREEMWSWFSCLISGLHYIHHAGVRHRDIKPSNILVKDKAVVIADFGSANWVFEEESTITMRADFTTQYAAPEVLQGERGRPADIFALGCVFVELMSELMQHSSKDICAALQGKQCGGPSPHWAVDVAQKLRLSVPNLDLTEHQLLILENCEAMTRSRPEQRPTAPEAAAQIESHPCCEQTSDTSLTDNDDGSELEASSSSPATLPALVSGNDADTLSRSSSVKTVAWRNDIGSSASGYQPTQKHPKTVEAESPIQKQSGDTQEKPSSFDTISMAPLESTSVMQRYQDEYDGLQELFVLGYRTKKIIPRSRLREQE